MSSRSGKRKSSSEVDNPSNQKHNPGRREGHEVTTPRRQTNPFGATATSSPPKTPQTPRGTSNLGIRRETAKSLMKHGSKLGALYNMLYGFMGLILDKKPESEEEFK